jgi:hypothetical protein
MGHGAVAVLEQANPAPQASDGSRAMPPRRNGKSASWLSSNPSSSVVRLSLIDAIAVSRHVNT